MIRRKIAVGLFGWVVLFTTLSELSLLRAFNPPRVGGGFSLSGAVITRTKPSLLYAQDKKQEENNVDGGGGGGGGPLSFLFNPYESKIPKEIEKEIYEAEGNTPAAQERGQRIALYASVAFVGILLAFFNGFISELRASTMPDGSVFSLEDAGFGWVEASFLSRFFFMNKIGGGILLLTGAGAGLLAEAEYDTRRINAERIYEELVRRRSARQAKEEGPRKKKKKQRATREKKRMSALSEVLELDNDDDSDKSINEKQPETTAEGLQQPNQNEKEVASDKKEGGILGTVTNFYKRADSMAASQALLLNKKLEDAGVLEKITDETGLRVVSKQQTKETDDDEDDDEEEVSSSSSSAKDKSTESKP